MIELGKRYILTVMTTNENGNPSGITINGPYVSQLKALQSLPKEGLFGYHIEEFEFISYEPKKADEPISDAEVEIIKDEKKEE